MLIAALLMALTPENIAQNGSAAQKFWGCKKLGWSTYRFKLVIFDPSTAKKPGFFSWQKKDLFGFAIKQAPHECGIWGSSSTSEITISV